MRYVCRAKHVKLAMALIPVSAKNAHLVNGVVCQAVTPHPEFLTTNHGSYSGVCEKNAHLVSGVACQAVTPHPEFQC